MRFGENKNAKPSVLANPVQELPAGLGAAKKYGASDSQALDRSGRQSRHLRQTRSRALLPAICFSFVSLDCGGGEGFVEGTAEQLHGVALSLPCTRLGELAGPGVGLLPDF